MTGNLKNKALATAKAAAVAFVIIGALGLVFTGVTSPFAAVGITVAMFAARGLVFEALALFKPSKLTKAIALIATAILVYGNYNSYAAHLTGPVLGGARAIALGTDLLRATLQSNYV